MIRRMVDAVLGTDRLVLARYIVSGLASGLSMLGVAFGSRALGAPDGVATTAGVLFSFVVSFLLQKFWVFRSTGRVFVAGARFAVVTTLTWALSLVLYQVLTIWLAWPFAAVQLAIVVFVAFCNFTINRLWTFRSHRTEKHAG